MKGLILLPYWANQIINNNKTWEIRKNNCNIRGKIYILTSQTHLIVGEAEIVNSFPLTKDLYEKNIDKHQISCPYEYLPDNYKYVWVLENIKKYDKYRPYEYKKGAQVWINLE